MTAKEKVEIPQPVAMLEGYTPFYIIQDQDVEKAIYQIISTGEPVFYVLANQKESFQYKENNVTKYGTNNTPTVFKVTSNMAGTAIRAVKNLDKAEEFDKSIGEVTPKARFSLPPIPRILLNELDSLFRHVEKKLGTESIVILTFNPEIESESDEAGAGWGYEVPKQKNTAGFCDYDPKSVIQTMADEAFIAGSAHSHPGMSAFCSGIDKKDQEGFDGLHITFGWGETKGEDRMVTKHHIELQLGGAAYSLAPEDAFGPLEDNNEFDFSNFDEVIEKAAPKGSAASTNSKWLGTAYSGFDEYDYDVPPTPPSSKKDDKKKKKEKLVKSYEPTKQLSPVSTFEIPDELVGVDFSLPANILILAPAEKHSEIEKCLGCGNEVTPVEHAYFRCSKCLSYFHGIEYDIEDILEARLAESHLTHAGLKLLDDQFQAVWYWVEEWDENNKKIVDVVNQLTEGKPTPKAFQGKK